MDVVDLHTSIYNKHNFAAGVGNHFVPCYNRNRIYCSKINIYCSLSNVHAHPWVEHLHQNHIFFICFIKIKACNCIPLAAHNSPTFTHFTYGTHQHKILCCPVYKVYGYHIIHTHPSNYDIDE